MQSQRVEEALHGVHQHQHRKGDPRERVESERDLEKVLAGDPRADRHFEEDLRELGVRQGKRPEAEVGRRVRDPAEHELDRLDGLVDDHFPRRRLGLLPRLARRFLAVRAESYP